MPLPLLWLLACVDSKPDTARPGGSDSAADTGSADTDDPAQPFACPVGMVSVPAQPAPGAPAFCVHPFESSLDANLQPISVAGVLPAVSVTWMEAKAACEALELFSADGTSLGFAHLITSAEWEDAADGTIGEGGHPWPYGDTCDYDICVTPAEDNSLVWPDLQPTGTMPDCRNDSGIYDMAGNAWEWADPGQTIDSGSWFAARAEDGLLVEEEDGLLVVRTGDAGDYLIDIAGASQGTPDIDADGHLCVTSYESHIPPEDIKGFLQAPEHQRGDASDLLPVSLSAVGDDYCLRLLDSEDGMPITDKRGGAWYVGNAESYRSDSSYRGHSYDFDGTIGFRCAW